MNLQEMFNALGIRARVLILALLPVAIVAMLLGYQLTSSRLQDVERTLNERGALMARNLALANEFALVSRNFSMVDETLQRLANEPEVEWAGVWDLEKRVLITRGLRPDTAKTERIVQALENQTALPPNCFYAPIEITRILITDFDAEFAPADAVGPTDEVQRLGFAVVDLSRRSADLQRSEIVSSSVLITSAGLFGSTLLALLIGNGISSPVTRLINVVKQLSGGNLGARAPAQAGGEIGDLERGLNQMAAALEGAQQDLQHRVETATGALKKTVAQLEVRNRELDEARKLALQAGQERTEFLARMSHEIRTPLNAVVGFARLLEGDGQAETREEHLRTIQRAADQLLHVINDILQFIRLDAGAEELESLPVHLGELLEDVVAMLGPMAHAKGLDLVLVLHSDLPETIDGDPTRLSQIVLNLLNNAIKFTERGHVLLEATRLETDSEAGAVEIAVSDTGIGLTTEEQSGIFAAFTQADSSVTRRFGGTGLGLAISKRLCELMDGTIGVQSKKGMGTRFSVRLPCKRYSPPEPIEPLPATDIRRVLVYDPNPFVRRGLRSLLARWSIQVFSIGQWDQVLQMLGERDRIGAIDSVILGLSEAELDAAAIKTRLGELRAQYAGDLLLLSRSDDWSPPAPLASDPHLRWSSKPIRRATLRRLLETAGGDQAPVETGAGKAMRLPRLGGMQVLLAEDNSLNRELIRHLLEQEGVTVDEAVTGLAAVSAAERGGYDAILMDLHMPEIDGGEAARQIRANLGAMTPPILLLTADVFRSDDLVAGGGHFDYRLLKPVDPEQLIGLLAGIRGDTGTTVDAVSASGDVPARRLPNAMRQRYLEEMRRLVGLVNNGLQGHNEAEALGALHDLKGITGMRGDPELLALVERLTPDLFSREPAQAHALLDEVEGLIDEAVAAAS